MPTGRRIASIILAASILLGLSVVLIAEGRSAGEVGEGSERGAQPLVERSQAIPLAPLMGSLYFSAKDDTHGRELWKSDGTAAGTVVVKDVRPGSEGSLPRGLTDVGGTLYFSAGDGTHGGELWRSDGTATGTVMVKDIWAGSKGSHPSGLTDVGGTLYFAADDGTHGWELWKSDGTARRDRHGEGHLARMGWLLPFRRCSSHRRRGFPLLLGRRRRAPKELSFGRVTGRRPGPSW